MKFLGAILLLGIVVGPACAVEAPSPLISEAPALIPVPGAAFRSDEKQFYKAIFDSRTAGKAPSDLAPAIVAAAAELNALSASGVPNSHIALVIDFHAPAAVMAIVNNAAYRAKYGIDNPNLPVLAKLKAFGVKLYVSAQVAFSQNISLETLSPDVSIAEDGLVVLTSYQNEGYALMLY